MKKTFFTGRNKRKLKTKQTRSNSDENLAQAWYSTDPRDLPDGFTVGSMSVPYSPRRPQETEELHGSLTKKKEKKIKGHKIPRPESPLVVSKKKPSASPASISKNVLVTTSPIKTKRANWAGRMQRSCSVDALNEIDDGEAREKVHTEAVGIRRTSTEGEGTPATPMTFDTAHLYRRGVSYNPEPKKRISYHGPNPQPSYSREISHAYTPQRILHEPKSTEHLLEALKDHNANVNLVDEITGDAPIHSLVKRKKKDHTELVLTLLINSNVEVDLRNRRKMTALHLALEVGCEVCAKTLIIFGADINLEGCNQFTPLDLVINNGTLSSIETILLELGAKGSTQDIAQDIAHDRKNEGGRRKVGRLYSFAEKLKPPKKGERLSTDDSISEFINRRGMKKLYNELEINVRRRMSISATIGGADDAFALVMQQRELALYNRTLPKPKKDHNTGYGLQGGSRILFLDGGGIKGLVQLEVLMQLEERTQCKITDLFDWIVGTSTGGIIALATVYAGKTLGSLRQLYFLLKDRIFMKSRYGFGYNSEALEEILQDYLDPKMKMSAVSHPKVLIAAVNKETTNLELCFFNNCFGDDYVDYPIWKVARYTSAAPMFFNEFENYVDGGVICNNPTDYGLTAIQNFCRLQGYKLPIAMVVSIGTGIYPPVKMGNVDAQDALFFGKQWLKPGKLIKQTQNLLSLLSNALVESELVAENSKSRCEEQGIPFFRFSPKFDEVIAAGETDNEKLFNMIIKTKLSLKQDKKRLDELTKIFHAIEDSSKSLGRQSISEEEDDPKKEEDMTEEEEKEVIKEKDESSSPQNDVESQNIPEEEDESIVQLVQSIKEENQNSYHMQFTGNFLVNSHLGSGDVEAGTRLNDALNERPSDAAISFQAPDHNANSSASVNHNSAQASPVLYKHYRRDNKRLDESRDEYTDYNRETLV